MIKFHKVSFEQYGKDIGSVDGEGFVKEYDDIILPRRATLRSAGYDFISPVSFLLQPNCTIKIPTGIRVSMALDNVLMMYVRSSVGFKYDVVLSNSTGIIDADYFNAKNEGHIWIKYINHGTKTWQVNKGDAIAQGIFNKYYITEDDEPKSTIRVGGIGSTGC